MSALPIPEMGALRAERSGQLPRASAEAMALHETGFFRDRAMFQALRELVLPRMIAANGADRQLRVWCAGCSTGQEVYSVAMLLHEHFAKQLAGWRVDILATDISADATEYARRGLYRRTEVNHGLPARLLVRYFAREGEKWEVKPEVRSMCEFAEADVRARTAAAEHFDLVLLRNVLLFLPVRERAAVFAGVHQQMRAHGLLALGQAEQAEDSTDLFEAEYVQGCCFYRKAERT